MMNIKKHKGFAWLPVLLIALVVVAGGGVYLWYENSVNPCTGLFGCFEKPMTPRAQTDSKKSNAAEQPSQSSNTVTVPGMSKYTDTDFGFSFWYPSSWRVERHNSGSGSFSPMTVDLSAPQSNGGYILEISMLELDQKSQTSSPDNFWITFGPNKFLLVSRGSTESTVDPKYIVATVLQTTSSSTAPDQAEQIKVIQAERDAYDNSDPSFHTWLCDRGWSDSDCKG